MVDTAVSNIMALLTEADTTTSECAEDTGCDPGAPCSSDKVLVVIEEFAKSAQLTDDVDPPSGVLPDSEDVRTAAAVLGCTSESCIINHPTFRDFAEKWGVASQELTRELELRYKAPGPRNSFELLSNNHIDSTLRRWARVYPDFFPCTFAMMDFDKNGDRFGTIDLLSVIDGRESVNLGPGIGMVVRAATTFGCVLNTDVSTGGGKHWVAAFVDCRPSNKKWTVEYFNSAGNPPPRPVTGWMERTRARLQQRHPTTTVAVTTVDHQESQTECGLYALYYIRCRLTGTPHQFFFDNVIPDAAMTEFRRHVFRAS